jgi:hypothetical protein
MNAQCNLYTKEYQQYVFQVKMFIKYELFKEVSLHHVTDRLIEIMVFVRGYTLKTRHDLENLTGQIERELDDSYLKSPISYEVHYHDYLFSMCCNEIIQYFYQKEVDAIEALKQLFHHEDCYDHF